MRKTVGRRLRRNSAAILGIALLSAACTSSSLSASPSVSYVQTSPSGQTVEFADADLIAAQVLPAGGSVDVPLSFEGSTFGSIQVVSNALVTATFGGTSLDGTATATYSAISTSVSNPSDGPVHIVNQGTAAASVTVIANVGTTRHLTVTPPLSDLGQGGTAHFDAVVSEATDADGASAYLQDASGSKTPVTLTKVGTGHWTGQVSPTIGGSYEIHVQTTGARVRYGTALVAVSKGNLTIGSGFTEQLLDTDGDGLADQLVLSVSVTALNPGKYLANADLFDVHGTEVSNGSSGGVSLVAGTQPMAITFDGASIYKSGISGPYHLVNVAVIDDNNYLDTEAVASDLGATKAYDYRTFQH
jgi:hypothetical protein